MSKKKSSGTEPEETQLAERWDIVVVGASPAGCLSAFKALESNPNATVLVLEATQRPGGRAASGFQFVRTDLADKLEGVRLGTVQAPARVRWDREWVEPSQVKWADKDWAALLPQWQLYFGTEMVPTREMSLDLSNITFVQSCPVSALTRSQDTSFDGWRLEVPNRAFFASKVIWAAGLTAFQNAVGKIESQPWMTANPRYNIEAADHRGGISLSLNVPTPRFADGVPMGHLWGLPLRHGGKLHLLLVAFEPSTDGGTLQALLHVHRDVFAEPGEIMSLQKSIRRAVKMLFQEDFELPTKGGEKWVVTNQAGGHVLGTPWLLDSNEANLAFVGDESLKSNQQAEDILSAFAAPASL